jgi:hypothetical protein
MTPDRLDKRRVGGSFLKDKRHVSVSPFGMGLSKMNRVGSSLRKRTGKIDEGKGVLGKETFLFYSIPMLAHGLCASTLIRAELRLYIDDRFPFVA